MEIAGDSATKRGINGAQEQGFNINIIESYGSGNEKSDPADIILKDPKQWEESLAKAKSIMDYYIDSAFLHFDAKTPEGKKEIGNVVLPAIKRLANKIEQSFWVQTLSQKLGVKEEAILEELSKIKFQQRASEVAPPAPISGFENKEILGQEGRKKLIEEIKKVVQLQKPAEEGRLKEDFKIIFNSEELNVELKNFLAALALSAELQYQEDGQEEVLLCLLQLKNIALKNNLNVVSDDIKKAEGESDSKKVAELIAKFNQLTKEL